MNQLLELPEAPAGSGHGRQALKRAIQQALDHRRALWRRGEVVDGGETFPGPRFWQEVEDRLAVVPALGLRPAINATGVVLHTGLGRAPWPAEAAEAAAAVAGACLLEIEADSGKRGRRESRVSQKLAAITGAGGGLAVNNNAAAVLLTLSALARGRQVVLARGEMVEIGGSYRMPEVVEAAGAEMVPVGTTNRCHLKDYLTAMERPQVACVLKVHPSNYRIGGFHQEVPVAELAQACRQRAIPFFFDLGSGILAGRDLGQRFQEPTVSGALQDGVDLVSFSGDKLLGGPQAGLIVGALPLIERLRRDMLTRCLRLDKSLLAALEAVLSLHALGEENALQRIPALRRLTVDLDSLRSRAEQIWQKLAPDFPDGWRGQIMETEARVGSGAGATETLPSVGLAISADPRRAAELARGLRLGRPSVFGYLRDGGLVLDLRTVDPEEDGVLLAALRQALSEFA
ncbi:MAG: L-seryl-tRNA(Sec) selenium transferase [Planctomycetota bacterium]|nr:MAG: L-seryl-tRNA(Sec) selenium transferase [Planctomycetota bacterium]